MGRTVFVAPSATSLKGGSRKEEIDAAAQKTIAAMLTPAPPEKEHLCFWHKLDPKKRNAST